MAPRKPQPPKDPEREELRELLRVLWAIHHDLQAIRDVLTPKIAAIRLVVTSLSASGVSIMAPTPTTLVVGKSVTYSVLQLDAAGVPLSPQLPFDTPPVFTEDTPAVESLSQDPLASTAVGTGLAAGTNTVSVAVSIGGTAFKASDLATVTAPVPVVASIAIVATPNA